MQHGELQSLSHGEPTGLDAITTRAALDPEFRRRLLCDPREAIASTFGIQLPPALRVKFIEKEAGLDLMVVLPDAVPCGDALADTELRGITGGAHPALWILSHAGIGGGVPG
jgi:hypothetical protein